MSVASVAAQVSSTINPFLAKMLARLDPVQSSASGATSATDSPAAFGSPVAPGAASNCASGPSRATLSDQIVSLLVQMQQASATDRQSATSQATPLSASSSDPLQQLFAAMDTNGDGVLSQSETETYIQSIGGTQQQANALFAGLDQSDASGISETQLADAAAQGAQTLHHHHRHGHGGEHGQDGAGASSGSGVATQMFSALDTNKDGTVSADELAAALGAATSGSGAGAASSSANTLTFDGASKLFSAIDTNGDNAVSQGELQTFMATLEQQLQADMSTMGSLMQVASISYDKAAALNTGAQANLSQSV